MRKDMKNMCLITSIGNNELRGIGLMLLIYTVMMIKC